MDDYKAYFERNKARASGAAMHDPAPRVVLVPGLGLFGLGASAKDARIAADIAEATVEGITDAEAIGRFTSISEADMFDCEYWPLELAKLGARKRFAARRPGRGHHRRRRRHRRGHRASLRGSRRGGGAARSRCRRGAGKSQGDRRQRHRDSMRCDRRCFGARRPSIRW